MAGIGRVPVTGMAQGSAEEGGGKVCIQPGRYLQAIYDVRVYTDSPRHGESLVTV